MSSHHFKVEKADDHIRLDVYLTKSMTEAPSRTFVKKLIDHGCVRVNEAVVKAHHKVVEGDDVGVEVPKGFLTPIHVAPEAIDLDIVYEDDQLLVINKPNGMTVHPAQGVYSGTLVNALMHYAVNLSQVNDEMRPGIVHRLDKDTSGVILIAKDNITHTKLAKQFQRHTVKKQYIALVEGEVAFDEGKIEQPIGRDPRHREKKAVQYDDSARDSVTFYRVIKRKNKATLIALFPKTGRTHQLRVHMAHLGHPILGDVKYGRKATFPRLALHAQSIGFVHPATRRYVEFSVKPPAEFLEKVK